MSLKCNIIGGKGEKFEVQARGELQMGLLIEGMRRDGYEMTVSPPMVMMQKDKGDLPLSFVINY